jgi:acetyltransferase-like isoleucine patch superfamily enzyme
MYRKAGIHIGKNVIFGSNNWLDINYKSMIYIGDNAAIAGDDRIFSHDILVSASSNPLVASKGEFDGYRPTIIGKGARLGSHVLVVAGAIIGEYSVIGAGAVIVKDIPPYCLAVGVPAKPIRYFKHESIPKKVPKIFVTCKTCGVEFWSAIVAEKQVLKVLNLKGSVHPCPNCGAKNRYDKKDYYYKE